MRKCAGVTRCTLKWRPWWVMGMKPMSNIRITCKKREDWRRFHLLDVNLWLVFGDEVVSMWKSLKPERLEWKIIFQHTYLVTAWHVWRRKVREIAWRLFPLSEFSENLDNRTHTNNNLKIPFNRMMYLCEKLNVKITRLTYLMGWVKHRRNQGGYRGSSPLLQKSPEHFFKSLN